MLKVEKDFEDFIELLNNNDVKYLIVGAYALALYAKPRNARFLMLLATAWDSG